MARRVERDEVLRMVAQGAQIVDVLPRHAYRELHVAGAINIPLGELDREAAERFESSGRSVVVYCNDYT